MRITRGCRHIFKLYQLSILVALIPTTVFAQATPNRPTFAEYVVKRIYQGPPTTPTLSRAQRVYRTMIRRGAKSRVEFAGHYTVPNFGCGGGCNFFYIVDSITGKVYDGFAVTEFPGKWLDDGHSDDWGIQFVPSSRLFKVNGCPDEHNCGFYDYIMVDGKGLRLIRKQLLPADYQH